MCIPLSPENALLPNGLDTCRPLRVEGHSQSSDKRPREGNQRVPGQMSSSQTVSFPHTAQLNTSPHTCFLGLLFGCFVLKNGSNKSLASDLGLPEELPGTKGSLTADTKTWQLTQGHTPTAPSPLGGWVSKSESSCLQAPDTVTLLDSCPSSSAEENEGQITQTAPGVRP